MTRQDTIAAMLSSLLCAQALACAEGVPTNIDGAPGQLASTVMEDPNAIAMGPVAGAPGDAAALPVDPREPCAQGAVVACICEATGTEGQRTCMFDLASPSDGFFTDCAGCVDPALLCQDGAQGEAETDVDCGGGVCTPCGDGASCVADTDCAGGSCSEGVCAAAPTMPDPGTEPDPGASNSSDCNVDPSVCSGALACCAMDGSCGMGFGALCF